jgi:DNA-binding response OmpR family regulator
MKARNPIAATTLEDDLIKQLIAYELIFKSKGIDLFWDVEGCSVTKTQASVLTSLEQLLQENLNSRHLPTRITISTRNDASHTTVTVSGEQYRVRPDRFSDELNALFAKLDSNYQFAVYADSWTLTLNLLSRQVESNGSSAAQRQIEAENLKGLAQLNSDAMNYKPVLLLVEPNNELRGFLLHLLDNDYRVLEATDGEQALELATANVPDLIISDTLIDKVDGLTLLHYLAQTEETSHISLIVLSGLKDKQAKIDALQAGAVDYVVKPFIAAELLLKIRNHVQNRYKTIILSNGIIPSDRLRKRHFERDLKFISTMETILKTHSHSSSFDIKELAHQLSVSERQLQRKVKGIFSKTPAEYIRSYRLERARSLLLQGKPIYRVCELVGFSSTSYFSRSFKAEFGCSPSDLLRDYMTEIES